MFSQYFQQELTNLRDLGTEFSNAHPALAPLLKGPTTDPDVERLLEGVAFLSALLRQKLDDDFPEIIHEMMRLICPHYLRPIPSTTIIEFRPKSTLKQSITIPPGSYIASVPVEGTPCFFRTAYSTELHPLSIVDASFVQPSGKPPEIKLLLELNGMKLSDWKPNVLRFFLAGDFSTATDLYFLLQRYVKRIIITPFEKGSPCILKPDSLKPVGFSNDESLIPYPSHSLPSYRILQEYIVCPEKFLFIDLSGWGNWHNRGDNSRFEISFELDDLPFSPPRIQKNSFVLFVTPAINVFPHEAEPILLDHRKAEYLIRPSGSSPDHYQIYSVEKVVGFVHGTAEEKVYVPFEFFKTDSLNKPVYQTSLRDSPVREGFDVYLSVAYSPQTISPVTETLSIHLMCTNGSLADKLQIGDISLPTSSSPEFADFRNILPPTPNLLPPLGSNLLWRLLSHMSLNYLSLAKAENLKAILGLYFFPETRDRAVTLANRRRIEGIESVEVKPSDRLVAGIMMRGKEIALKLRQDHFASQGDLFLFGCILDHFFGNYASMNTYTKMNIKETIRGDIYQWPARLGNYPLI